MISPHLISTVTRGGEYYYIHWIVSPTKLYTHELICLFFTVPPTLAEYLRIPDFFKITLIGG